MIGRALPKWNLVRWLKFNTVGAMGIAIQLGALALLKSVLNLNYLIATALAVEAALLHNFLWHETFTWPERKAGSRGLRLLNFNLTTGVFSIAGNLVFTQILASMGVNYLIANLVAITACSLINFVLNDRLVFRPE